MAELHGVATVERVTPCTGATAATAFTLHEEECLRRRKLGGGGALEEEEEEAGRRWSAGGGGGGWVEAPLPSIGWACVASSHRQEEDGGK